MSFPTHQSYSYHKSVFTQLFSLMSRKLVDPQTKAENFYLKMDMKSGIKGYTDSSKQQLLFSTKRTVWAGFEWDVFDGNDSRPLGHLKKEILKTMSRWGAEQWTITDPSGNPSLIFDQDSSDTSKKHILDYFFGAYYNPQHQYNIWNAQKQPVARIWTKHGIFKFKYDLVFEDRATEDERKMAMALFGTITLLLKK